MRVGFCNVTEPGESDCEAGMSGSWPLSKLVAEPLKSTASALLRSACHAKCLSCPRCNYMTWSATYDDCSWYHACDLKHLTPSAGFESIKVRALPIPPPSLRRFSQARLAVDTRTRLLALGVLVKPHHNVPAASLDDDGASTGLISYRFVSTNASLADSDAYVVVPCADGFEPPELVPGRNDAEWEHQYLRLQRSCLCKALWWFRRALVLFPGAKFYGKAEDDTVLAVGRLLAELGFIGARSGYDRVWYGYFQWAVHDGVRGAYCGSGDDAAVALPGRHGPQGPLHCRPGWSKQSVVAPFASGGLDVRSRSLAELLSACDHPWAHEQFQDCRGSCDGMMGFFAALCLENSPDDRPVWAWHLTDYKFGGCDHRPAGHEVVLHPCKLHGGQQGTLPGAKQRRLRAVDAVLSGEAHTPASRTLLPLPYELRPTARHLGWVPRNRSASAGFVKLAARKAGAAQLCAHLPCLSALREKGAQEQHASAGWRWPAFPAGVRQASSYFGRSSGASRRRGEHG